MQICTLLAFAAATLCTSFAAEKDVWRYSRCPSQCICAVRFSVEFQANLRTVDCSNLNLHAFPASEDLPSDSQILLLTNNRIRQLSDQIRLWLPELLHLDVSHNRLTAITNRNTGAIGLFEGVYNLRILNLSHNNMKSLDDNVFQGLFNLEELDLSHNRLAGIMDDAFRGLLKLETLRLSQNKLTYVQHSWWRNVGGLYNLYLDRNHFSLIQADSFKPLRQLLTLDLSRNRIFRLNSNSFYGLTRLEKLQLANNALTGMPRDALKPTQTSLKSLDLSRNPIFRLSTDDLANFVALKDVSLTSMQRLRLVERGAFKNLPQLLVVQMHDNPYLAYIDSLAFVNAPELTHLLLHNNNLSMIEAETMESLRSLEEVSFYGNPLSCDCNARWLKQYLVKASSGHKIVFQEAERMVCDSPAQHKFKLFASLALEDLSENCAPRILYMFDASNVRKIGEDIVFDCRAIGFPKPSITWVTPEGRIITPSSYHPRRFLRNDNTLVLRHLKEEDAGLYTCIAESQGGSTLVQTTLNITSMQVQLFPTEVGATSASVSWNGTDRYRNIFQILYREITAAKDSRHHYAATVTPAMSSYTLENLRPNTDYEVCIAYEDGAHVVIQISCATFFTRNVDFLIQGIERTGNVAVGAALGIVASMLILVCLAAVGLKRGQNAPATTTGTPVVFDFSDSLERGDCVKYAYSDCVSHSSSLHHVSTENIYSPLVSPTLFVESSKKVGL